MPRKPPAEPIDHHYNIPRLNRAFFWGGIALAAVFIWMVIADYDRDWKNIQRTFMPGEAPTEMWTYSNNVNRVFRFEDHSRGEYKLTDIRDMAAKSSDIGQRN